MQRIMIILFLLALSFLSTSAQEVVMSYPEKIPGKFTDFDIIGRNSMGILVHRFGTDEHAIEVYNDNLRPIARQIINLKEKKAIIEELIPLDNQIIIFYSIIENGYIYLKAKKMAGNLEVSYTPIVIDSLPRSSWQGSRPFYIKASNDNTKILVFYLLSNRSASLEIKANILDAALNSLNRLTMRTEGKEEMALRSIKMNDKGNIIAVVGHESRKTSDGDLFTEDKYTVFNYYFASNMQYQYSIAEEDYRYKDVITGMDNSTGNFYLAGSYQHRKNMEDIGLFVQRSSTTGSGYQPVTKFPFTEEGTAHTQSYTFKNWYDKAAIIRPKKIIPRSDGGFVLITQSEYQFTRVVRMDALSYSMYGDQSIRYYDQNHYYDIGVMAIGPDLKMDWSIILPKAQVSEGDGGIYSSYALFQANNVLKFLFNEDLTKNGNFLEYNINPRGEVKRNSLLNADKQEIALIPQKAKQLNGNMILVPGVNRKSVQLVLIKY